MKRISPERELFRELLSVEKPGRYTGGEFGICTLDDDASLRMALCFPDLYEIGMSNLAVRSLYQIFNRVPGLACERVFAPAPDFEDALRNSGVPLYGLESGTPLCDFDLIGFSVGYELSATMMLTVLQAGHVPMRATERSSGDPVVIGGGPALTNPVPFGPFLDAVFIGEAEGALPTLLEELVALKRRGGGREALMQRIVEHQAVWTPTKKSPAFREVWTGFGDVVCPPLLPVPGIKTVQDHGVIEIMRGCPNGCRFCHAGIFYRPLREKQAQLVFDEAEQNIYGCGYREITISSLSTGDYVGIAELMRNLNKKYAARKVSFSLPSLHIDSFTLGLLDHISAVRRSGITFAVETPEDAWQRGINKEASLEKTLAIMREARSLGWRLAKFYFMLGLPVTAGADESASIAEFLREIQRGSGMQIRAQIGTFVPKPHTPFQWAPQLSEEQALERLSRLKYACKGKPISVSYNAPFGSYLEGVIARGDRRVGELIYQAYLRGARLDAWEDRLDRDLWRKVIDEAPWDVASTVCAERSPDERLPWHTVKLGVTEHFLKREYERAMAGEATRPCNEVCASSCGVCRPDLKVRRAVSDAATRAEDHPEDVVAVPAEQVCVVLFAFEKRGKAVFLSHLNVMSIFERAFLRAGLDVRFTEGFNPKPRLEFAHPLTLGFSSTQEIARIELERTVEAEQFEQRVSENLHEGLSVTRAVIWAKPRQRKDRSLMSLYWGADYRVSRAAADGTLEAARSRREATAFREELVSYCRDKQIDDSISVVEVDDELEVRVRQCRKESNLARVLIGCIGKPRLWQELRVRRVATYAKGTDDAPVSYFSEGLFSPLL